VSLVCDGILIAIILFTVLCGWSKGFIKSFMGLIKGAASAFAAYAYTPVLSKYLHDNFIIEKLTEGINDTLSSLALDTTTDLYNLDRLAADLPAPLVSILERYNINLSDFTSNAAGLTDVSEDVVYQCSSAIASPTASMLASAAAFTLIFIGVFAAISLITGFLNLIFRMPVLNAANKFLGFVFGAAEALLIVSVMSILLSALVSALGAIDPQLFGADIIENTTICKFFVEHNPLGRIYDVLM